MKQGNTKGIVTRQPPASHNKSPAANPRLSDETAEEKGFFDRAWDNMRSGVSRLGDNIADGAAWVVNNPWEATHLALDVVGMIPVVGEVADGANAVLYLARGDYGNAALSASAMIHVVGSTATMGKMADKAVTAVAKRSGGIGGKPPSSGAKVRGPKRARMQPHRVACFKPVNTPKARAAARQNIEKDYPKGSKHKTEQEYLRDETHTQLSHQGAALNKMTVKEYMEGRDLFNQHKRNSGHFNKDKSEIVNVDAAREEHRREIARTREAEYKDSGINRDEAEKLAEKDSYEIMETLALLHDPDQVLAGDKAKAEKFGLANVNASIGSNWNKAGKGQLSRVESIDKAVKDLPEDLLLNIVLEVCS
ncbi:hypothetical protein AAEX37_01175 [Oligella sp. MSHR50489EDL]|uniref:polymorphic toxin type 15 domain-containing protein n=1 Tax=Oligella sp. MSHR50489EDL TaxID=3139409 RepID=UPI003D817134